MHEDDDDDGVDEVVFLVVLQPRMEPVGMDVFWIDFCVYAWKILLFKYFTTIIPHLFHLFMLDILLWYPFCLPHWANKIQIIVVNIVDIFLDRRTMMVNNFNFFLMMMPSDWHKFTYMVLNMGFVIIFLKSDKK